MMDEFDQKRDLVKSLLDMLKNSAGDEVMAGLKPPEGMPEDAKGLEIEKVSVIPHDEKAEDHDMSPEGETLADEVMHHGEHEMSKGGEAKMEEPKEMPLPTEDDDMDDDMPMPAFASFMKKKGKK